MKEDKNAILASKQKRQGRKVSAEGRKAMARSGSDNLRRYREGQVAEATKIARERVAEFEKGLRDEFPDPSPIVSGLVESAITSYISLIQVSSLQSIGCARMDRIERIHAVQIESQRSLFRALKVLLDVQGTPEHREAVLQRVRATIPAPTEEERKAAKEANAARIKAECEAAKKKFAWIETGERPDED